MKNSNNRTQVVFFRTALGWMGLGHDSQRIQRLVFGCQTRSAVEEKFAGESFVKVNEGSESTSWIEQLQSYAAGEEYDFSRLPLDLDDKTDFQRSVIKACRKISHGTTVTYRELAKSAGSEGAARAVGSVMSRNRIPLIIPCHRVVSSSGLGGFSAAEGITSKRTLLRHEGCQSFLKVQKQLAL